ncbi:hypothetical protein GAPWK_1096 [Gilliamella apicola]|nr:hypothetical protein GAPWK_1096 [Gilliamella apicola]PXV95362.1 hypothetical protein C7392_105147 [Gilliamella apicola]
MKILNLKSCLRSQPRKPCHEGEFRKKGLVMAEKKLCAYSLIQAGLSVIKACKLASLSWAT